MRSLLEPTEHDTPLLELSAVRAGYGIIDVLHGVDLRVERDQSRPTIHH